jgi:arsenate reductase
MAEGLLRWLGGDSYEALSAGTRATQVRPEAVAVMREIGVDIRGQSSKSLDRYLPEEIDVVVTVCDEANEECPVFLNARRRMHWSIDDPARAGGTEAERLSAFR